MKPRWVSVNEFGPECIVVDCGERIRFGSDSYTKAAAIRDARKAGWILTYDGWKCPQHSNASADDAPQARAMTVRKRGK